MPSGADRWQAVRDILYEALERPEGERAAFLDSACGNDAELRREVEELLRASDGTLGIAAAEGEPARAPDLGPTLGRYLIRRKIGEGGMGAVYEAEDPELGRRVALKIIADAAQTERARRRFAREARAASALNHPGIVTVYELGNADGLTFIAMELVEGETLSELRAPLPKLLDCMRQAAEAIGAAHAAGIVHRDLKPGNLMVTKLGQVKVLDFGLARRADEDDASAASLELTAAGQILGTPAYMSPEQAIGEPVGSASDIFSFGVVLYELACGVRPFAGKSAVATIDQVLHHKPLRPRQANPALDRELGALIERCLEKSPTARPASMAEVAATLGRLASPGSGLPRRSFFVAAAGGLAVAVAAAGGWAVLRPRPEIQWSMEARASTDDLPRPAKATDTFHAGMRFRLRLRYPRSGRFYVVNRGSAGRYWILFAGAAEEGSETVTDWYAFDETPGVERLRVVWSPAPVADLETIGAVDPAHAGRVSAALDGGVALDLRHE